MTSPSEQEEQWFKDQERKKREDATAAEAHALAVADREARKQAHWMKCPKCGGDLAEKAYESIRIDECTECHGAWLDPGELGQLHDDHHGGLFSFLTRTR